MQDPKAAGHRRRGKRRSNAWGRTLKLALRHPRTLAITLTVLLAGLVITTVATQRLRGALQTQAHARFDAETARLEQEILRRYTLAEYALQGMRAALLAAGGMGGEGFRALVRGQELQRRYPGVAGFNLIEPVAREQLAAYVEAVRQDAQPGFLVRSSTDAPTLLVVRHAEPADVNAMAGFDVRSDPVRLEAAERALRTGEAALSAPVPLLIAGPQRLGWVLMMPLEGSGAPQRRLLSAGLAAQEMLAGVATPTVPLHFRLLDGDAAAPRTLFDSRAADSAAAPPRFTTRRTLSLGGRQLGLQVFSRPALERDAQQQLPAALAAVGSVLSLLVAVAIWLVLSARDRAEAIAMGITADLRGMARVVERTSNAVFGLDPGGRITWVNDGFTRLVGLSRDDCIGLRPAQLPMLAAGGQGLEQLEQSLARHEGARVELRTRTPNGEGWTDAELQPMRDARGVVTGFICIASDITARKQAELRMRENERLMRQARDVAIEASQAKSRFLSSMSHEIRTPMNAVLGMLALLRGTPLDARQQDYADKAERAGRSLLGLIDDILDLSKIEAGKMVLDPHPFAVDDLLRDLAVIFAANAAAKDIEVLFDVGADVPPHLVGDALRLRQALINLGANAIKFTARGEVVLRMRGMPAASGRARIEVSVSDTGIGISPDEQQRLFADFSQASDSTARRFGGTGLGLSITRKLLALMGSELRVQSTTGRGSRFSFELDLPLDAAAESQPTAPAMPHRVLIVDDNEPARAALARMAAGLGWQADLAADGMQALARVERMAAAGAAYDAVFVDWLMPGLDGFQTARRIRQLSGQHPPPMVVLVTPQGREMLTRRSAEEQALLDGCLVKPVTASMLAEAVARAVPGAAMSRRAAPKANSPSARSAEGSPVSAAPAPAEAPAPRPLAGMRLLLAEDNPTNQQVASELLAAQGAQVEIAEDGAQALERIRTDPQRYDAVLMDVMMPVMDGHAATRAVREQLGNWRLPIIAMTANAMENDRVESLAAGMNDHVGKPFDIRRLVQVVLRHTGRTPGPPQPAPPPATEAANPVLDQQAAIRRLGGEKALYKRLLPGFIENLRGTRERLPGLLHSMARADAVRLVHSLKGSAAALGAVRLAAAAAVAERALGQTDPGAESDALAALATLDSAIGETLEALERPNDSVVAPP